MIKNKSFASLIFFGSLIVGVPLPQLNNIWEVEYKVVKSCNSTTSVCSKVINSSSVVSENSTIQFVNNSSSPKDLHKHCSNEQGCKTEFSNCSNGICSCRDNYVAHDGVCYGLPGAQCHLPKDCVSVPYSCKSGTCQLAIYELNGKHILSKPEVPSFIEVWNPIEEKVRDNLQIEVLPNGLPLYLTRSDLSSVFWIIKGPSKWRSSNYTLDEAIPRIDLVVGNLNLYCRIKRDQDRQYGRLEPPLYDKCIVHIGNDLSVYDRFEILVG
ncbi:uncharacterized protein LOC141529017 isoform X2 [Cotesia typhae]|uniref:uncharacterized protein LOC141529017 isoform X2 n=1 Tax=Cotesia typhae TaxID=2053667 RepID=UPI003D69F9D3